MRLSFSLLLSPFSASPSPRLYFRLREKEGDHPMPFPIPFLKVKEIHVQALPLQRRRNIAKGGEIRKNQPRNEATSRCHLARARTAC